MRRLRNAPRLTGGTRGPAVAEGLEIAPGQDAYELVRGVGGLCAGGDRPGYDVRKLVGLLVAGLR